MTIWRRALGSALRLARSFEIAVGSASTFGKMRILPPIGNANPAFRATVSYSSVGISKVEHEQTPLDSYSDQSTVGSGTASQYSQQFGRAIRGRIDVKIMPVCRSASAVY